MELKEKYELNERFKICIYANSDENGNITQLEYGQHIIPGQDYMHFFRVDRYISDTIWNYNVVINGRIAELQAIDIEVENTMKERYFSQTIEELEKQKEEMEAKIRQLEEELSNRS
ncbi:phosphodiesterase [Bacillus toyonensis]|uniref:phosphodiesterase n=1 Tax=Bacillus toyonensis TaxID=155322 RepID=UPI000BEFC700|nr:phosphodiesterase [Bacillus toyonensis]MCU5181586.1 phosphodiesterase [Bacillus toyonensis]PEI73888.1 phosphodiesterase [Bacillus toyonensis]